MISVFVLGSDQRIEALPNLKLKLKTLLDETKREVMKRDGNTLMIAHFKHNKIPITND
jgi:hypothetical protein